MEAGCYSREVSKDSKGEVLELGFYLKFPRWWWIHLRGGVN